MKIMKKVTGALTGILALTAIILDLTIYFGYSGTGQMYTAPAIWLRLKVLLIPFVLWLISAAVTAILALRSSSAADDHPKKASYQKGTSQNRRAVKTVRIILTFLAAVLIVTGIMNGGVRDVLVKAINICTECIGLG